MGCDVNIFFFKQKTAYEMRISDWSSDCCSSDLSSKIDSRTILDQSGAETLLGHGDMLYLPPGTALPERVHGAFVSDEEVHRVVEHLKQSGGGPDYIEGVLEEVQTMGDGVVVGATGLPETSSSGDESDPLYDEIGRAHV